MKLMTIGEKAMKARIAAGLLAGFIGTIATTGTLRASTFWDTRASGSARKFEITCSTCPNPTTNLSNLADGGFGDNSATVEFSDGNLVTYDAKAIFAGPNSLPHLGTLVTANITTAAPSTFFYEASAVSRATQMYTYTGTETTDYTLAYDVDGQMVGGILTELAGGFTVFGSGFDPRREFNPVLGLSFDHVNGDGTDKAVHFSGNVTFTVNPGDNIFVQATLDAFADSRSQQLFASADALHTLSMSFTQGDTSLLIPASTSAVPEPSAGVLSAIGVAAVFLGSLRRRKAGSPLTRRERR